MRGKGIWLLWFMLLPVWAGGAAAAVYRCKAAGGVQFQDWPCGRAPVVRGAPEADPAQGLRRGELLWLRQRQRQAAVRAHRERPGKRRRRRDDARARRCWARRQRLEQVADRLRRGYRAAQGERLRRQRRTLEDYLSRFCD
jgi:hypothetical protein